MLSYKVTLSTDEKTLVKKFIQPYDPSALAKDKITTYKNVREWAETMDYIDDLSSKYALNQKVKTEDITGFPRDVYRYTAFNTPLLKMKKTYLKNYAILIEHITKL